MCKFYICFVLFDFVSIKVFVKMSQSLEMRAAVRTNGEALKRYIDFEQMQKAFISYKNKVEIAVEALRDIAGEIHEIEVKNVNHKKNGYITSTVGSSVLGTSLIGGLLTANPLVSVGIFAGTVLTSLGSIIVLTKRDKDRLAELDREVTRIMVGLEGEFEKCHSKLASLDTDCHNIDQLTTQLRAASIGRDMAGSGGSNLDMVTNLVGNINTFSRGLRSRINELPADVRLLLNDSLQQIQYFISPYGASQLVNIIKNEIQRNPQSSRADICCAGSFDSVGVCPAPPVLTSAEGGGGGSLYSRCGKVGKVLYSVGAVFAAYEFYNSFNKAKELTKWLQRLRDSAELLKYNGTAKEVFNISLDLQVILAIFKEGEEEYEMVQ